MFFDVFLCGTMWHYVALYGTMWRYVALSELIIETKKALFHNICLMCANCVALCGTMWHYFNTRYFMIFECFLMFSCVALCGAMWHYVALSALFMETQKKYFSQHLLDLCKLCGTMWHYFNTFYFMIFWCFLMFSSVALCGAMWHYVALSELFMETETKLFFTIFARFVQIVWHFVALCGTMWHYFNTCYFMIFWCFLMFFSVALCGAMWHYVALSELFIETKKRLFFTLFA